MLNIRSTTIRNMSISSPPSSVELLAALAQERKMSPRWRRAPIDEDIFQEVSARAHKARKRFVGSDIDALAGWVCTIHTNEIRRHYRKLTSREEILRETPLPTGGWQPRNIGVEELAAAQVIFSDIETQISGLPSKYAAAAYLNLIEDRTAAETAALLNVPLGTAKTRISVAKQKLRAALPDYAPKPAHPAKTATKTRRKAPCVPIRTNRFDPETKFEVFKLQTSGCKPKMRKPIGPGVYTHPRKSFVKIA